MREGQYISKLLTSKDSNDCINYVVLHSGGRTMSDHSSGTFEKGTGVIWLDNVECTGTESSLKDCPHRQWGRHNCQHNQDAGCECKFYVTIY